MDKELQCPIVDIFSNDPSRYKLMLDSMRDAGADHVWTSMVPTGELSCWVIGRSVVFVQRVGDGVDLYTNNYTPRTFKDIESWLKTL